MSESLARHLTQRGHRVEAYNGKTSQGSRRPTLTPHAVLFEEPSTELVAEVEERMEAWAGEVGVWWLFQVMTVVAQVMELVRQADASSQSSPCP